jgi:hypothetical protein
MVRAALLFRLDRPPRDFGIAFLKDLRNRAIAIYRGAPEHGRPPDARALARCVFNLRPDDTKAVRLERRRELGRGHLWRSATPCVFHLKLSGDRCRPWVRCVMAEPTYQMNEGNAGYVSWFPERASGVQASFFCSRPSAARNSRSAKFPGAFHR